MATWRVGHEIRQKGTALVSRTAADSCLFLRRRKDKRSSRRPSGPQIAKCQGRLRSWRRGGGGGAEDRRRSDRSERARSVSLTTHECVTLSISGASGWVWARQSYLRA